MTAVALAAAIRRGELSATQSVQAAIARIERDDGEIHTVVTPLFERALERAATVTGPFAGVPMLLKDAGQELAGTPHFVGLSVLRDAGHVSTVTTPLAARFEELGFVIVGKSACPAFSSGVTTEPAGFSPTRNPFDRRRTVGGSSGGSAAAVAAGMVSIAAWERRHGIVALPRVVLRARHAPAFGRSPRVGAAGGARRRVGVVARVRARSRPGRPGGGVRCADHSGVGRASSAADRAARHGPTARSAARAGVCRGGRDRRTAVGVARAPPRAGVAGRAGGSAAADLRADRRAGRLGPCRTGRVDRGEARPARGGGRPPARGARRRRTRADAYDAHTIDSAVASIRAVVAPLPAWWDEFDVLVTPTMRRAPWPLGEKAGPLHCGMFAAPFSFTSQPSVNAPVHVDADGLPIGVQLVGRVGADEVLLDLLAMMVDR